MQMLEKYLNEFIEPMRMGYSDGTNCSPHIEKHYSIDYFDFTSFDGKRIQGKTYLLKKATERKRCLIYTHSHSSNKMEGEVLLENCIRNNLSLVVYDSRGCGTSDKTGISFGEKEQVDLLFVLFKVLLTEEIDNFILFGRSIGCCAVLRLLKNIGEGRQGEHLWNKDSFLGVNFKQFIESNKDCVMMHERMRFVLEGVILDSPVYSVQSAISEFFKKKFVNLNFVANYISSYTQKHIHKKLGVDIRVKQNHSLVKGISTNVLFVFSKDDYFISNEQKMKLISNFGCQAAKKPVLKVLSVNEEHNEERSKSDLYRVFEYIKMYNANTSSHLSFEIQNNFNIEKFKKNISKSNLHQSNVMRHHKSANNLLNNSYFQNPITRSEPQETAERTGFNNHMFLGNEYFTANTYGKPERKDSYDHSKDISKTDITVQQNPVSILEKKVTSLSKSSTYNKKLIRNYSEKNIHLSSVDQRKNTFRGKNSSRTKNFNRAKPQPMVFKDIINQSHLINEQDTSQQKSNVLRYNKSAKGFQRGQSPLKQKVNFDNQPNFYQEWAKKKKNLLDSVIVPNKPNKYIHLPKRKSSRLSRNLVSNLNVSNLINSKVQNSFTNNH